MLNELAKEIHENAIQHGWWEDERSLPEILMLCVSQLAEALEEYRNGKDDIYYKCTLKTGECPHPLKICDRWSALNCKYQKPEGIAIELADCIIRILDYCGAKGIDIDEAIRIKHEYNKDRPYKHGGKVI